MQEPLYTPDRSGINPAVGRPLALVAQTPELGFLRAAVTVGRGG